MEQFNKALSFVLGLVVVAVFIIVASGKFNIKGLGFLNKNTTTASKITPTVTPYMTPKPTSKPWYSFLTQPKVTPTVKPKANPTLKPTTAQKNISYNTNTGTVQSVQTQKKQDPNYKPYVPSNPPTSIPNTGVPIVLFPLFGASLIGGAFMKRAGKKE